MPSCGLPSAASSLMFPKQSLALRTSWSPAPSEGPDQASTSLQDLRGQGEHLFRPLGQELTVPSRSLMPLAAGTMPIPSRPMPAVRLFQRGKPSHRLILTSCWRKQRTLQGIRCLLFAQACTQLCPIRLNTDTLHLGAVGFGGWEGCEEERIGLCPQGEPTHASLHLLVCRGFSTLGRD